MLKIRLTRRGKKNKAFFRLVVAEHASPIKGKFIEVLGFVNPHTKEKDLKEDRIKYWISKGAQCSDSAHNLLVSNGVIEGPKRAVRIKKKPVEPASADASADARAVADKPASQSQSEKPEEPKTEEAKTEEAKEEKPEEEPKKEE